MSTAPELLAVRPTGTLAEIEAALEDLERLATNPSNEEMEIRSSYGDAPPLAAERSVESALLRLVALEVQKVDGIAALMQAWSAWAESCELAAERLRQRAERLEARRERLARYVATVMQAHGLKKLEGERHTITLLPGRERVEIGAEDMIPGRYMVEPLPPAPRPDKRAIAEAIKRGEDVLGARLVQGEPTVRIYQ